jgi:hypothetical protein
LPISSATNDSSKSTPLIRTNRRKTASGVDLTISKWPSLMLKNSQFAPNKFTVKVAEGQPDLDEFLGRYGKKKHGVFYPK